MSFFFSRWEKDGEACAEGASVAWMRVSYPSGQLYAILPLMRRLTLLFMLVIAACAPVEPVPEPEPLGIIDFITVDKSDRTLTVYRGGRAIRTYTGIGLGDAPLGHKQFEGDERTPEGRYIIDTRNPNSAYHLSLRISYPNAQDRAFAEGQGMSPGGDIFIHGQPNGMLAGRIPGDWTDGCIAVSNEEIEELWAAVPDGTPIEITP